MRRTRVHNLSLARWALALMLAFAPMTSCRERPSETSVPVDGVGRDAGHDAVSGAKPTVKSSDTEVVPQPVHIVHSPTPGQFIRLVQEVGRSVVNIRTKGTVIGGPASMYPNARPDGSLGSGILVDRRDGYVLTNLRIVENATSLHVVFNSGETRAADIVGTAPHLDVALLRLGGRTLSEDIPNAKVGESDRLQVGEWVVALGNPFGGEVTASAGIISSVGGTTSVNEPPHERYRSLLHTDAAIHRGNAGGPLIDLSGRVIGVNVVSGRDGLRLGFAVPMSQINRVFEQLKKGAVAETWLGIYVAPVTEANAGGCAATGVSIVQVVRASPAARAALQVGDIIVRFDGHEVDGNKLAALSRTAVPNQRIAVQVCRAGGMLERTLVVEAKPN